MRGREDHQPRAASPANPRVHVQPLVVHRNGDHPCRGADHRPLRAEVARVLEPDRLAGVDHQPQHLLERLLCPGGDEDLLGSAARTARGDDVLGDRAAETGVSGRVSALEEPRTRP